MPLMTFIGLDKNLVVFLLTKKNTSQFSCMEIIPHVFTFVYYYYYFYCFTIFYFYWVTRNAQRIQNPIMDFCAETMVMSVLFSIHFPTIVNIQLLCVCRWADVFIELPIIIPATYFQVVTAWSDPNTVNANWDFFLIVHCFYVYQHHILFAILLPLPQICNKISFFININRLEATENLVTY